MEKNNELLQHVFFFFPWAHTAGDRCLPQSEKHYLSLEWQHIGIYLTSSYWLLISYKCENYFHFKKLENKLRSKILISYLQFFHFIFVITLTGVKNRNNVCIMIEKLKVGS